MRSAIEMEEGTSEGFSVFGLVRLLIIPAIALTLMLTLTLGSAAQPSPPAQSSLAEPSRRQVDEAYTLYLYSSDSALSAALNEAVPVSYSAGRPTPDWYARVDTAADETEVMRAWDHANWIRHDSGLPAIALVDLRLP